MQVLRAHVDLWDPQDPLESPADAVDPEPTVRGACRDNLDPRETEASTVWPDFLVKRDTEVNPDPTDLLELLARMERGEMMESSDPGDFLANQGLAVCWDPKDPRVHPDPLASPEPTDPQDPKATSDLKESQDLQDSKATPVLRDFQGLKEPSGLQERRVPLESPVCLECQELTDHRATLGRRGLLERKDTWAPPALKDPSVTPGLEA